MDILVADFSTPYIKHDFKFDAIITDPPYGIREKAKKVGNKKARLSTDCLSNNQDDITDNGKVIFLIN